MKQFKYILSFNDSEPIELTHYPDFDSGQSRDLEKEVNQQFYRAKISGAFIFKRNYFDLINDRPDDTKFTLEIFSKWPTDAIFISEDILIFYKQDAEEIDEFRKSLKVQPLSQDKYKDILDKSEREFDVIENVPSVVVNYKIRPVFQLIALAENVVQGVLTNVFGGISFEQSLIETPVDGTDLSANYNFGQMISIGHVTGINLNPDISGSYQAITGGWLRKSDSKYLIAIAGANLRVTDTGTAAIVYEAVPPGTAAPKYDDWELNSLTTTSTARFILREIYGRYVTNQESINGVLTQSLPANDVVTAPAGLTRVLALDSLARGLLGLDVTQTFVTSDGNQADPTRYGAFSSDSIFFPGQYFTRPDATRQLLPISRTRWTDASFWFTLEEFFEELQISGSEDRQARGYKFSDILSFILSEISPGISHAETAIYSKFLYEINDIRGEIKTPIFIPKNRILVGEDQEPDRRYLFKFSDVKSLLEMWRAGWHIDDDNRLVIEGGNYYYNGRSYTAPQIGLDVTQLIEGRTGLPWDHNERKYKPEKAEIPAQIRTQWMDDSSDPFRGFTIDILSPFADQAKIIDIFPSQFSADLEFILIAGADRVSKDGYLYAECISAEDGEYNIPFETINVGAVGSYTLQNVYCSWIWMADKYFRFVMPAPALRLNLEEITAESTIRTKTQSLDIPAFKILDPSKLIITSLGTGALRRSSDKRDGSGGNITIEL